MCSDTPNHTAPAIVVEQVHKQFQLYKKPQDRIWQWLRPHKHYAQPFDAIKGVSFTVQRGETVGIIGRNGSGKSTLLQMICGTLQPSSGRIQVQGRVAALLELGAGFNPEFSGRENIYLNGAIMGLTRREVSARMDAILAFADIGAHIDQPVKTYSSGMYVRLAFAIIAHVDADILIIDEALAVGDALFTQKCMRYLRQFKQHGTILFVSHDSAAVTNLCERAVWLHAGEMRASGAAKDVCEQYLAWLFNSANNSGSAQDQDQDQATAPRTDYATATDWVDQRQALLQHPALRSEYELFAFDPQQAGFGQGGAQIHEVRLTNQAGQPLNWAVGLEKVQLQIQIRVLKDLDRPIVGFYVKDRLGQELFGDNTYLSYAQTPVAAPAGSQLQVQFEFIMPLLPPGDYTIAVAIANGTQLEHEQHHWIHDAVFFQCHSRSAIHGLVGVPMQQVQMHTVKAAGAASTPD